MLRKQTLSSVGLDAATAMKVPPQLAASFSSGHMMEPAFRRRLLAQMRRADRVEQCQSSEAKRKASTRDEYFAF
jgi:hypothetical protein